MAWVRWVGSLARVVRFGDGSIVLRDVDSDGDGDSMRCSCTWVYVVAVTLFFYLFILFLFLTGCDLYVYLLYCYYNHRRMPSPHFFYPEFYFSELEMDGWIDR